MTEENVQDTVQENPSNVVKNEQESPSDPSLLQEIMAKKAKIKEQDEIIAQYKAEKETGRQKKLADSGKYKELDAEKTATIDKLNAKLESQTGIVNNYKQNLINGLTSDDERREHLSTKSVDFLEELTKERAAMAPLPVSNPVESLGAVRRPTSNKPWTEMSESERRDYYTLKANEQALGST